MTYKIKEGSNYVLTIKPVIDTSKFTVSVRAYDITASDGTSTFLGRKQGVIANTLLPIKISTKALSTGTYRLEVFGDFGDSNQITLNNDNEYITLIVENVGSI